MPLTDVTITVTTFLSASAVIHEEDECPSSTHSRRSTMDKSDLVVSLTNSHTAPSKAKPAQSMPAAALDRSDFAALLSNPQGTQPASQPSAQDKFDFAALLSDPQGSAAKSTNSSPPKTKKSQSVVESSKSKKSKKLIRQVISMPTSESRHHYSKILLVDDLKCRLRQFYDMVVGCDYDPRQERE